ncbi:MAG: hypothetical protein QXL10_00990 [Candidatus Bathyarchaeia archaeon]
MSVNLPVVAMSCGGVNIPQEDIAELKVFLRCSREVSSFEALLQNWDGKYYVGGDYALRVGYQGGIGVCRLPSNPVNSPLISFRVESLSCEEDAAGEHYVRLSGRCWGERLFRRVITKTYEDMKGEDIVRDLLDNYVGLSHNRGGTELVEATDTTYTKLEYENTPVWDIIKYIAETADKQGVIGYDFRVAPDGKFEFFPKNSKTSAVSLSERLVVGEYRVDIHRVRNRIVVYGVADKSYPLDKDGFTEILQPTEGSWTAVSGEVAQDNTVKARGNSSVKCHVNNLYYGSVAFTFNSGYEANCNLYPALSFLLRLEKDKWNGKAIISLFDASYRQANKTVSVIGDGEFHVVELSVGKSGADSWDAVEAGFDWSAVKAFRVACEFPDVGSGDFWVDGLFFGGRRYSAVAEDTWSQQQYGLRELVEVDDELWSDNECLLRAKALLAYLSAPAVYLEVGSDVVDYGTSPILAGDRVHVQLPNIGVNDYFRVEQADYTVSAKDCLLRVELKLGKAPPLLADYLYGLRTFTVNVEKLARTKQSGRGILSGGRSSGGGGGTVGAHYHKASDVTSGRFLLDRLPTGDAGKFLKATGADSNPYFEQIYAGDVQGRFSLDNLPTGEGGKFLKATGIGNNPYFEVINAGDIQAGRLSLDRMPSGDAGKFLKATGSGSNPYFEIINAGDVQAGRFSLDRMPSEGATADVAVAKVGGGTRTLHFSNGIYTGFTDS